MTARKPNAVHKLTGGYRPDRHGSDHPDPIDDDMPAPAWLDDKAREQWDHLAPMLRGMGMSSSSYSMALALLASSLARYVEYEAQVSEVGPTSLTDNGNAVVHPVWAARNKAWEQSMKALREFGLTPVAISSVAKPEPVVASSKSRFFDGDVAGQIK